MLRITVHTPWINDVSARRAPVGPWVQRRRAAGKRALADRPLVRPSLRPDGCDLYRCRGQGVPGRGRTLQGAGTCRVGCLMRAVVAAEISHTSIPRLPVAREIQRRKPDERTDDAPLTPP